MVGQKGTGKAKFHNFIFSQIKKKWKQNKIIQPLFWKVIKIYFYQIPQIFLASYTVHKINPML